MNARRLVPVVCVALLLPACTGPGNWFGLRRHEGNAVATVAASLFPLAEVASRVGGQHVKVLNLTPDGRDAHDVELTAKQLDALSSAMLALYIGADFQPTVASAIEQSEKPAKIDVLEVVATQVVGATVARFGTEPVPTETDPHVWLDPANMVLIARRVQRELSVLMPNLTAEFTANADAYVSELGSVGDLIDSTLVRARCTNPEMVVSHDSFGYLAARAGLVTLPITGSNPDAQVSAKRMESIVAAVRNGAGRYVVAESLVPTDVARTVARLAGVPVLTVNPLEGMTAADVKAGKDYPSVMRENIATIARAYGCR